MSHDSENQKMDELTLQRLVDNELSHDQVRQLLAEAEFGDDATKWKQIALAFTENQMFERAFCWDEVETISEISSIAEISTVIERSAPQRRRGYSAGPAPKPWWGVALAVSLLLVTAVAYQGSNLSPKVDDSLLVTTPPTVDLPATVPDSRAIKSFDRTTLASYEPDHQLETKNIDSASIGKHSSPIPLYDIGRLSPEQLANLRGDDRAAREAMFSQVLPKSFSPELVQQLQQSGGMVDQNLEFISGRLDDGRSYVIPYRTIRFLPGQ